jgi:ribosomal protein S27AE
MTYITTSGVSSIKLPAAFITKGRQRVKQYSNSVYLKNQDEFEIELFNPHQIRVLAKIKINGTYLSSSGLILNPGQRVFLERYIDDDKKFIFSVYDVESNNSEVLEAIQSNGIVEVSFYNEMTFYYSPSSGYITTNKINYIYTASPINMYSTTGGYSTNISSLTIADGKNYTTDTESSLDYMIKTRSDGELMETGRIDKGNQSKQKIGVKSGVDFEFIPSHMVTWNILPYSTKPIEVSDLKRYCPNCGSRIKKSTYKFCPNCGNELN